MIKPKKSRQGLVPVKKKTKTGAMITFWMRPEKVKKKEQIVKKEDVKVKESIPIKGLNKGIDFKANETFLNDEIKGVNLIEDRKRLDIVKKQLKLSEEQLKILTDKKIIENVKIQIENDKDTIKELEQDRKDVKEYESFAKNLTPVHSLSVDKFLKVLKSGSLKSLEQLGESGKQAGYAIIESEIRPRFGNEVAKIIYEELESQVVGGRKEYIGMQLYKVDKYFKKDSNDFQEFMKIDQELRDRIREEQKGAIGYSVDKEMGTNNHVFSIVGPNGNGSGYGEISIVLKQEIMEHPDFNMTPVAGTSFYSGEMYNHREWTKNFKGIVGDLYVGKILKFPGGVSPRIIKISGENVIIKHEGEKEIKTTISKIKKELKESGSDILKQHFHKSKLNKKENKEYYKYMAKDISAQGSIDDYLSRSSHGKWEGHLPVEVPVSMFQEAIIQRDVAEKLYMLLFDKTMLDLVVENDNNVSLAKEIFVKNLKDKINIKVIILESSSDILPYMNKSFKDGKYRSKD